MENSTLVDSLAEVFGDRKFSWGESAEILRPICASIDANPSVDIALTLFALELGCADSTPPAAEKKRCIIQCHPVYFPHAKERNR